MFWKKRHSKLIASPDFESNEEYSSLKKRLFESPIYTPTHNQIELPSDEDGLGWASGLEYRRWAFGHFENFGEWINSLLQPDLPYDFGPWKIEQLSDPFLMNFGIEDGPVIGLRFRIFYNSECVGDLEISPSSDAHLKGNSKKNYQASININISVAPFLPFNHLHGFLCVCLEKFEGQGKDEKLLVIADAINTTLWESNRTDSMWVGLDLTYTGYV